MLLFFLYLSLALFFSFLCSILEAALLSTTPVFIESKIKEGKSYAKKLRHYKENIDLPLAAILTINTFAHTLGAAGVGSQAQIIWGSATVTIVSVLLTLVILIFSEIIPKTLGAIYWKELAPFTSKAISVLIYNPVYPFIILAKSITTILKKDNKKNMLSRSEFQVLAESSIKDGLFSNEESKILLNLMRFNAIDVRSIMTPRTMMVAAEENMSINEFYAERKEIRFSRIPIYQNEIDSITGFVLKHEIFESIIHSAGDNKLKTIRRNILSVNDQMPITRLFNKMINEKDHIALLVGEYGETAGVVTLEDIIETLVGVEIIDEHDNISDLQLQARKNWAERIKKLGLPVSEEIMEEAIKKL